MSGSRTPHEGQPGVVSPAAAGDFVLGLDEAFFGATFAHAAIGIVVGDLDRRILRANAAYERLLGYSEHDLRAISFPAATHPDDAEADRLLFAALIAGERESYQLEKRYVRRDGQLVWGRLTASLVRDDAGQPQAVIGMVEDITARAEADAALREREARYRAVVGQAAEGIFLFDAATRRITEANSSFCQLLGYTEAELLGLTLYDLVAHDRASIDANTAAVIATGLNPIGDRHYRRKDGILVTVEVSATALATGDHTDLCVIVRDVTAQRSLAAALAGSEAHLRARDARLRAVTEHVPIVLFALDPNGVVTFAAGSALPALGFTAADVIGRSIFASRQQGEIQEYVRRALDGEAFTATVTIRDRLFETRYAPLRDAGQIIGVSGVALDITARTRAETELRRLSAGLTPRERELLPLLVRPELTARQIGTILYMGPSTIRTHIVQIAEKLGVSSTRNAVVLAALERGLLDTDSSH